MGKYLSTTRIGQTSEFGLLFVSHCSFFKIQLVQRWDEWLEENGPKVKPWSNATAANVFTPNISRKQIAAAKIEVMRLLRTGFWTFRQPFFAAPTEEVPKVNRADIDAQTIY